MASQTDICNRALSMIGANTIATIDEESTEAIKCRIVYDQIRDETLRCYPWNFAIKRASLSRLSSVPVFGYTYEFQLPNDCLRVLDLSDTDVEFKIEGRKLLCDSASVSIRYIKREPITGIYDALFVGAFAARLASELAYAISKSKTLANMAMEVFKDRLAEAKAIDSQEGTPIPFEVSEWEESRIG